jgi:putative oxidoreductase
MIRSLAKLQPWALTLLRLVLGVAMVVHGWEKLIPVGGLHFVASLGLPYWLGYVSIITEFVGGLFLIFGLLTRFWAFMILGNMLLALWTVNRHHGYSGSEYVLALITMAFMLVVAGSGAMSLDRRAGIS